MYDALVKYLNKKKIDNNFTKRALMELFYQDADVGAKLHKSNNVQSFLDVLCRFGIATEAGRECYTINSLEDTLDKQDPKDKLDKQALKGTLDQQAASLGYEVRHNTLRREIWAPGQHTQIEIPIE